MNILLIGASSGIGFSILKNLNLNDKKKSIFIISRKSKNFYKNKIYNHGNHDLYFIKGDLKKKKSLQNIYNKISNIEFDYIINNSGIIIDKPNSNPVNEVLMVNAFSHYFITKSILSNTRKKITVINISSNIKFFVNKKLLIKIRDIKLKNLKSYETYMISKYLLDLLFCDLARKNKKLKVITLNPSITKSKFGTNNKSLKRKIINSIRNFIGQNPNKFSEKVLDIINDKKKIIQKKQYTISVNSQNKLLIKNIIKDFKILFS